MEEVGFVDQFVESDTEPAEQLEVVAKDIPNLVDARMDIGFHDQSIDSDMEIVEHLVVDDPIIVGVELCVVENIFVSNDIAGIVSLTCVDGNLDIFSDVEFIFSGMYSLDIDVDEDFLMKHYV